MSSLFTVPNEWQHVDKRIGLLFPWYTETFLEQLKLWNVSNWRVLEWGSGASTAWWAKNAASVVSVEHDYAWFAGTAAYLETLGLRNKVDYRLCPEQAQYINVLGAVEGLFDCVIIDGVFRDECALALEAARPVKRGSVVIQDNVELNPKLMETGLLRINECRIYPQPHHYNWRTACWTLQEFQVPSDDHQANAACMKKMRGMP